MTAVQPSPHPQDAIQALDQIRMIDSIEWIDWTALTLISVFFILGLFKGFVWQVSRVLSLVGAWCLAGRFGPDGETVLAQWVSPENTLAQLPLFLSYVIIFVAAIVVFSLITWLLQKLVKDTGMTFYDRIGGAVLGVGTGSLAVVAILGFFYMFFPESTNVVQAAQRSHTMHYSQKAMRMLGGVVPKPMRAVFAVEEEGATKGEGGQPNPNGKSQRGAAPNGTTPKGTAPGGK